MALRRRALPLLVCFVFGVIALVNFYNGITIFIDSLKHWSIFDLYLNHYPSNEILEIFSLMERQCRAMFPGLMKEIDNTVTRGPFDLEKEPDDYIGMVQSRIKGGQTIIENFP
jgi:hypothetical protein